MNEANHYFSRRSFLKTAAGGAALIIGALGNPAMASQPQAVMPTRPFGKTGIDVPILSFGGSLNTSLSTLLLRQAVKWGVTYWDTANSYMGGRSEKGMGKYFEKYPADRNRIFLVTKSHAWNTEGMSKDLNLSLERMQTDYIDLYFMHSVSSSSELTADKKAWAEKKKAEGKIRLFGFSTHSNMEECMLAASGLGWIDGIMMRYNYRLMHTDDMRSAMEKCARSGNRSDGHEKPGRRSGKNGYRERTQIGRTIYEKGLYRCPGQTQSRLGASEYCQHMYGNAQHDAVDVKRGSGDEPTETFGPGGGSAPAIRQGNTLGLLHRLYRHLRIGCRLRHPHW